MKHLNTISILIYFSLVSFNISAQQIIDSTYNYIPENPAYELNKGPVILVDEFHNNDMSINNRMFPLIEILKKDGYRIKALKTAISNKSLQNSKVLVIIGALHKSNIENWKLPTPSAISEKEVSILLNWIEEGGNLLLVADHMPFPGSIKNLSSKIGVEWYNGFVIDSVNWGMSIFSRRDKTLKNHAISYGRNEDERINWVASYYGSGFKIKNNSIEGIFSFNNPDVVSYQTEEAWKMDKNTPTISSKELYQAAILKKGKGRIALIGEASFFSAQLVGKNQNPVGLNFNNEDQNVQFVLNLFHWLSGILN